jgi:hypothetical protein
MRYRSGREFRGRLDGFVFAFRFINQALADWQAWDAPRYATDGRTIDISYMGIDMDRYAAASHLPRP